jgi:molybdate transport system substrate-binding protein
MGIHLVPYGCLVLAVLAGPATAAEVTVAVAANFVPPFREIAERFEQATGHRVEMVSGSSGKFYAQIRNGAPFDVFFSADQERPKLLEDEGHAVAGSRFTYAVGRLALWSPDAQLVEGEKTLREGGFKHLAIADPKLAPYGAAAVQVMEALGMWERLQPRIVTGESLGQTIGFVTSGNAELGFIALSQALDPNLKPKGSRWDIPSNLHDPIRQDAIVTSRGAFNPGARALVEYVRNDPAARAIIERFGYLVD